MMKSTIHFQAAELPVSSFEELILVPGATAAQPGALMRVAMPRELHAPEWNACPGVTFLPERFVALPAAMDLPPVQEHGWSDPLGPNAVRANATLLSLGMAATGRARLPGAVGIAAAGTNWGRALPAASVLHMQAPVPGNQRALAGFAAALVAEAVTDLIVVARNSAPTSGPAPEQASPAGHGVCNGFYEIPSAAGQPPRSIDDPDRLLFLDFLAQQAGFRPQGQEAGALSSVGIRSTNAEPGSGGLPRGALTVTTQHGAGAARTHQVQTHDLDPDASDWVERLILAMMQRWHDTGHEPLKLAVMCQDGASLSGEVMTALHGMRCLEDFNQGHMALSGTSDLAEQMRQFIAHGCRERSPDFARVGHDRATDVAGLSKRVWHHWTNMLSSPETPAVQLRRDAPHAAGRTLRQKSMVSVDSGFLSPSGEASVGGIFRAVSKSPDTPGGRSDARASRRERPKPLELPQSEGQRKRRLMPVVPLDSEDLKPLFDSLADQPD